MAFHTAAVCAWSRSNRRRTGSPQTLDTLLASWYPTCMQRFLISHSSCEEQYGDMSSERQNNTIQSFDTLLASWYPTYVQSFIISHSSCAEQYGDMSSERLTHSYTPKRFKIHLVTGSLGHHKNLTHCWHHGTRHTWKIS